MLKELAKAGTQNGSRFGAAEPHPGKQTMRTLTKEPIAPSAIAFRPEMQRFFATPRAADRSRNPSMPSPVLVKAAAV